MKNLFFFILISIPFFSCENEKNDSNDSNNNSGPNITDVEGNVYQSVIICDQTWAKSNLNVSKYTDGTPIPQEVDYTQWATLTTGAWCYYENNTSYGLIHGKLYNWYAVAGIYDAESASNPSLRKKLAPYGWHIPSESEWSQLISCLGGASIAGGKMKTIGTIQIGDGMWHSPNTGATNESGFTGNPSGYRLYYGPFDNMGNFVYWWSSSQNNSQNALQLGLSTNHSIANISNAMKGAFISVRCVKD